MKELLIRAFSGVLYATLFILSLKYQLALIGLFLVFGLICLAEFNKLIGQRDIWSYLIFILLYGGFCSSFFMEPMEGFQEAAMILNVISVFVLLLLIKDLFSEKSLSRFITKRYINTTFYISSAFVFLILIPAADGGYDPIVLLGVFITTWINDSFAYLVGKSMGKQKLFPRISPKKTVEGFLGGLFFACIGSFFISKYTHSLEFKYWLIIAIIVSVFGTLGDLVESKFKRQAEVKDSGIIMPGHGGLLDRLDSVIFTAPFIYLFLKLI